MHIFTIFTEYYIAYFDSSKCVKIHVLRIIYFVTIIRFYEQRAANRVACGTFTILVEFFTFPNYHVEIYL